MMKHETALASAMKRAGVAADADLLYAVAADCLRKAGLSPRRALAEFVSEVRDAGGIMAALHPRRDTEDVGIAYLHRVAADMRGESLKNPERSGAGGHPPGAREGHAAIAPGDSSPQGDGKGHAGDAREGHNTCG